MISLGKNVLKKIQNLLVQIDNQPKTSKIPQKIPTELNSKQKIQTSRIKHEHNKSTWEPAESKRKKNKNLQDKQNHPLPQDTIDRLNSLYLKHFRKQQKRQNQKICQIESEILQMKPFKVQNKISQYIIQKKKDRKPIYDRCDQILLNKQKSIQKIKLSLPKTKQQIEDQQFQQILHRNCETRLTRQQIEQKLQQFSLRNVVRNQRAQHQKLQVFERGFHELQDRPSVSRSSQCLFKKRKFERKLSARVLERFSQYDCEKRKNWQRYLEVRGQEETPFAPKISEMSRALAEKNKSRKSFCEEEFPRSNSCLCQTSRKQLSRRNSRVDVSFMEKCSFKVSKNHEVSTTTQNTSQNQLMSSRKNTNIKLKQG